MAVLKLVLPAALFVYLLYRVPAEDYESFFSRSKRWDFLVLAQGVAFLAVVITFLRWQQLVLAFGIPFTTREALRLGFLSYLLNFISFGSIGGDLFKAVIVARHKPQAQPEAVASVLLDRAIGLFGLILMTVIALVCFPPLNPSAVIVSIRDAAIALAVIGTVALALAVYSGAWFDRWIDWGERWPVIGSPLARMARAVRLLRKQPVVLLAVILESILVHGLLSLTVYCISRGLYDTCPTFVEHMFVVPAGMAAGALPLAPGGLGTQELALDQLFKQLPNQSPGFSGILVATVYRLITLAIAGIGLIYYGSSRSRELQEARRAAEELATKSNEQVH